MAKTKIVATVGPASDSLDVLRQFGCVLEQGERFVLVNVIRLNMSHGTHQQHADLKCPQPDFRALEVHENCCLHVLFLGCSLELCVRSSDGTEVSCDVVRGGPISDHKGINLPGVNVSSPSLTKKDVADLHFGIENGVDFVALSFVRKRDDVLRLRVHLEDYDAKLPIISKIEKPEAWANFDSILEESDGVMVARGDLGVEVALEKVPFIQKSIIQRARRLGKFVITATQMLESMTDRPYPTRAEVSDIANAIYDGTDALMLSGETAAGKYPFEAAQIMERIATEAETSVRYRELPRAFTPKDTVARHLQVSFGVRTVIAPDRCSTDEMLQQLDLMLMQNGCLKKGDTVVFVAGQPIGRPGTTNLMKLHRVGELH